jgi:threonine dehydratase
VDAYVTVTEEEIASALRLFLDAHHQLIEGAAAVAIASYLQTRQRYAGKNVVIVICGANIGLDTLRDVLNDSVQI